MLLKFTKADRKIKKLIRDCVSLSLDQVQYRYPYYRVDRKDWRALTVIHLAWFESDPLADCP